MALYTRPMNVKPACELVNSWHRTRGGLARAKFAVAAYDGDRVVGVAVCSRPVARHLDPQRYLEVSRVATNGHPNACSLLYAACARAAKAIGYEWIQTYTVMGEPGTTLRAAGWQDEGMVYGKYNAWSNREGRVEAPYERKRRWRRLLNQWPEDQPVRNPSYDYSFATAGALV